MELPAFLGFLCGLRRGEICGLRIDDIYLDDAHAFIRHSLDRMDKEEAVKLKEKGDVVWYGCESKNGESVLALGPVKTEESMAFIPLPDRVMGSSAKSWSPVSKISTLAAKAADKT